MSGSRRRLLLALLPLALAACGAHRPVDLGPTDADRLARTLSILRTASPRDPKVLRVLFYGQSISTPKWTDIAADQLRRAYPYVRFQFRNLAITGFAADRLERTALRDVTDAYPDLIVFHVYGDHHAYERIIRIMRSQTAADIIVQTDHVKSPPEPVCPYRYTLHMGEVPGCLGTRFRYRQRYWDDLMSGSLVPAIADRYGLAVEPRREQWRQYLERTGTPYQALLEDGLHPNARGWQLTAALFTRWLEQVAATWRGQRGTLVQDLPPPEPNARGTIHFDGNRIELIADAPLGGNMTVTIDGKPAAAVDGCWQNSRVTPVPGAEQWPGLRRIEVAPAFHQAERWTVVVDRLSAAERTFSFSLAGARTGADGGGVSNSDFASPSGRVKIAAQDWMATDLAQPGKFAVPDHFELQWTRRFVCTEQAPVPLNPGRQEVRTVLATGLGNRPHELGLSLSPSAAAHVSAIRVYRPPLAG